LIGNDNGNEVNPVLEEDMVVYGPRRHPTSPLFTTLEPESDGTDEILGDYYYTQSQLRVEIPEVLKPTTSSIQAEEAINDHPRPVGMIN
jgi:hypothetical protein